MASSRLYNEALTAFATQMKGELKSGKEQDVLSSFLANRETPQQAASAAQSLKDHSDKKWSGQNMRGKPVPAHWIDKVMDNIQYFIKVGNFAMEGAPESVGLAWLAVKLTLSAIQSNYELYSLFGTGLTDITEIMILILHFNELYDDGSKEEQKDSLVGILLTNIVQAYVAVLRFSFEIKRHLSANPLSKIGHAVADLFGASKPKFQALLDEITNHKTRVLEYGMAAYQGKSLKFNQEQETNMKSLKALMDQIHEFHHNETKYREEFIAELHAMKQTIEATVKDKTPWDSAIQRFQNTKKRLSPLDPEENFEPLEIAQNRRFAGTCQWILTNETFVDWRQFKSNKLLCITGGKGTGKSILLGSIFEHLGENIDLYNILIPVYFSCEASTKAKTICNTLLYQVYRQATLHDEHDSVLLEACNAVFSNPKGREPANVRNSDRAATKAGGNIAHMLENDDALPSFSNAMPKLAAPLKRSVVVILDGVDSLREEDRQELISEIDAILTIPQQTKSSQFHINVLAGCQRTLPKGSSVPKSSYLELDIEKFNHNDMKTILSPVLSALQGLSPAEREEAESAIFKQAGSCVSYITETGIPFMLQPFRGPINERLALLPQGMPNAYRDVIQKMAPNYLDLLRHAVTWCLLVPPRQGILTVEVVMDVFRRTYLDPPKNGTQGDNGDDASFPLASQLDKKQLGDAGGPFLDLELADKSPSTVSLRNSDQVREFCKKDDEQEHIEHDHEHICSRCKLSMSESRDLFVSEKEGHLDITLTLLRHINNPLFQKRARLLGKENDTKSERSQEPAKDKSTDGDTQNLRVEAPNSGIAEDVEKKESSAEDAHDGGASIAGDNSNKDITDSHEGRVTESQNDEDKNHDTKMDAAGHDSDGNDSDDSRDEEDRKYASEEDESEEVRDSVKQEYCKRYEIHYWPFHLCEAEDLWSEDERATNDKWKDVLIELDRFCQNTAVFDTWQRIYSREEKKKYLQSPRKPLHVAAYLGLTSWAKQLLDRNHDPNELSGSINALQAAAIKARRPTMLKLLLERGGDINAETEERPAFHSWLFLDSSLESVKLMLEHGADPSTLNRADGMAALHYLAWSGTDAKSLDAILNWPSPETNADTRIINLKDEEGNTPLHVLLWRNDVPNELLNAFLEHGADVNEEDNRSKRPLQLASIWGEVECLEILLRHNPLIDDDDNTGNTALQYAASYGHTKCVDLLISKGANVNNYDKYRRAPLHDAAWNNQKECTQLMLQRGADISFTDYHNRTPLFFACMGTSHETASLLLDVLLERNMPISEINKVTKRCRTPIRQACAGGFDEVVKKLIAKAKADNDLPSLHLDLKDQKHGMTPLHRAAWNGHSECVRALLEAGADVRIPVKDDNSRTALVLAHERWALEHRSSYEDTIFQLIEKDPIAAKNDVELLSLCAANGSIRVIRQLQDMGANFGLRDQYGWTPLELARRFKRVEVEQILKQQEAWKGLLPSRWKRDELEKTISEDGLDVSYTKNKTMSVTTDCPLPAGLDDFYFEVTCKPPKAGRKLDYVIFAIGFSTQRGSAIRFPGWPPDDEAESAVSWGYHGDDGMIVCSASSGRPEAKDSNLRYTYGDTVGCGVDLTTRKIWFTKNGKMLPHTFNDAHGRLFPVVGLGAPVAFSTTFVGPFKWDRNAERDGDEVGAGPAT
ncbi:ankyrin repeat-containing domain protein [Xylaria intraflava]|nr:ankyrin repeat-containing domain protein [Xylaria intraflava]